MIAIKNGKLITVSSEVIEKGTILIENGIIKAIAQDIEIPEDAEIIDAEGKWVTPGFIDVHTHLSTFSEPQARGGMIDGNEMSSPITAHIRGVDALNPHDIGIEIARKAGFTTCYTGPGSANVIGGTGIAFKLKKADTIFDMIIENTEHMKMALGENPRFVYGTQKKMPSTRMGVGAILRETLFNAKIYNQKLMDNKVENPDFKLEALVPVIQKKMKVRIHCHRADDIVTAVRIAKEFDLDYSIEHCTEGHKIIPFLKENNVDCVVGPLTMPLAKMEIWNKDLKMPKMFEDAEINFCLTEDTGADTCYLPMHIGLCIARGLSEKTAFEAITIRPAKLLGIDKKVGTLEVGKQADIAIFDGFPFSNLTLCEITIIDGEIYYNQ